MDNWNLENGYVSGRCGPYPWAAGWQDDRWDDNETPCWDDVWDDTPDEFEDEEREEEDTWMQD